MNNLYNIEYNSSPNLPALINHIADLSELTQLQTKEFTDIEKAVDFLAECVYPITTMDELIIQQDTNISKFTMSLEEFEKLESNGQIQADFIY